MFERLQLINWGSFVGHEVTFDAPLVDLWGENGAGKSTFLDALRVCTAAAGELDTRNLSEFQNDPNQPAYLALTVKNPLRGTSRLRFAGMGVRFTILVKVDGSNTEESTKSTYRKYLLIPNEDKDIKDAITLGKRHNAGWKNKTEFNQFWEDAGYSLQDRTNRFFDARRPAEIAKSNPKKKWQLFRDLATNPTNYANLVEARHKRDTSQEEWIQAQRDHSLSLSSLESRKAELAQANGIVRLHESLHREERLVEVARYKKAQRQQTSHAATLNEEARRRVELEEEQRGIKAKLPQQTKQLQAQQDAHANLEGKANDSIGRLKGMRAQAMDARSQSDQAKRDVADFAKVEKALSKAQAEKLRVELKAENDALVASQNNTLRDRQTLQERLDGLKAHRAGAVVAAGAERLRKAGISFTEAHTFLDRNASQAYEDASGNLRFGLLVKAGDKSRAVEVLQGSRYPGPISDLDAKEYRRRVEAVTLHGHGYSTDVGTFVEQGVEPVLNTDLAKQVRQDLEAAIRQHTETLKQIEGSLDLVQDRMQDWSKTWEDACTKERLMGSRHEWARTIAFYEDLDRQLLALEKLAESDRERAAAAKVAAEAQANIIRQQQDHLAEIAELLRGMSADQSRTLAAEVERLYVIVKDYLAELQSEAGDIGTHDENIKDLQAKLVNKPLPSPDRLKELDATILSLDAQTKTSGQRVTEKQVTREQATKQLEEQEEMLRKGLLDEFSACKRRITGLASKLGFTVELDCKPSPDGDGDVIHYRAHLGNHRYSVPLEKLSMGERQLAAFVFCLGMSDPEAPSFYALDEPAQNFGWKNIAKMFEAMSATNAQFIITSPKDLVFGKGLDIARYVFPDPVDGISGPFVRIRVNDKVLVA